MTTDRLRISASAWSADLGDLRRALVAAEPYCDAFHFDIMDGRFVPNLLFGPDQLRSLRDSIQLPFELHFMVQDPGALLDQFMDSGDEYIFHRRGCLDWDDLSDRLHRQGKRIGVVLEVSEDWTSLLDVLDNVDIVLVMGTALGIKGVSIEPRVYDQIAELRRYINDRPSDTRIYADGGIRVDSVPKLKSAGVDGITAGSILFKQPFNRFNAWIERL
jgi:ribulose-phosphate 3-epimerase